MASSLFHVRSDSLPTRSHPLVSHVDDHMCRLRASETTSTSSTSIIHNLSGLQDLHDGIDKLLHLPLTRQTLAHEHNHKWVDELLDGSLRVLDVCNSAKDALLQTKEYTLELQSTIRRRQGSENGLAVEVRKYLTSRKMAKKAIQKALNNLKGLENKYSFSSTDNGSEIATFVSMLREVEAITLTVFKSFLSFIYGPKPQPYKPSHWSLVSKLILKKRIASEEEKTDVNEFAVVDSALESLVACKTTGKYDNLTLIENVQSHLKNLELCIQHLEEGTHSLFRRMIKIRVSLLNILN